MIASKIIATIILSLMAILSFFKNIKVYEEDKAVLIFTVVDLVAIVFIGLVIWGVL